VNPYADIELHPSARELRRLALTLFVGFGVLGGLALWRGHSGTAGWLACAGATLGLLALVPRIGRVVHIGWSGLGVTIGFFTSPLVFGLIYFGVFFPIALVLRLTGRDVLGLRRDGSGSYWQKQGKPPDRESFFHQF
jgi:Saxitoxin biosynthesis operon protein SxtJ